MLRDMVRNTYIFICFNIMENKQPIFKVKKMTNQKWKTYEDDIKTKELLEKLEELKIKRRHEDFKSWLNSEIFLDNDKSILVKHVLEDLVENTVKLCNEYGIKIINEKQLRDTVASMIYKESRYGK